MEKSIELASDTKLGKRSEIVQRIGWAVIVLFLVASGAGLLGPGRFVTPILSSLAVYFFLLIMVRLSGRRTLGEMTTFDFILLLIVSEACQNALVGQDDSIVSAWTAIATLVGADFVLSFVKTKSKTLDKWIEGVPSLLIRDGKLDEKEMKSARVDEDDIREAARTQLGLSKLKQVRHAVLEKDGSISIIPWRYDKQPSPT